MVHPQKPFKTIPKPKYNYWFNKNCLAINQETQERCFSKKCTGHTSLQENVQESHYSSQEILF